jgi:acyl-CoA synthetase (NDP forming)
MDAPEIDAMTALMAPRSVAVVGATERPDASSSFVMRNLMAQGFGGPILPVNPRGGTIFGHAAATSLADLETKPDVVVIGIAADRVNSVLKEAAELGVKSAVVLASGFAELDDAGRARQNELAAIAREHGMAICGPNCLGLYNLHSGAALYSSTLSQGMARGSVALVSHSGASAIALANTGRIGLSHIVSSGNSAATDLPDYISWLAKDERTGIIGLVLEAIRDPEAFAAAVASAHKANKRVIALRVGRSAGGQRATAAHTGALAGSREAYASFFRRTGIVEVANMDEFIETATLLDATRTRPLKSGVAVIGVSGGGVAHVADIAEETGVGLPAFAPKTVARLKELLPPFATPQNPLDTTGVVFADADIYTGVLETVAADPAIGVVVAAQDAPAGLDEQTAAEYLAIAGAIGDFGAKAQVPTILISNLSAGHHPQVRRAANGAVILNGTRSALLAVKALLSPAGNPVGFAAPAGHDRSRGDLLDSTAPLSEGAAKAFFQTYGLTCPKEALAKSADEAASHAAAIGLPVVMKIESPDLHHKTDAGGVRLAITTSEEARSAYLSIMANVSAFAPDARLEGVSVQEMVVGGVEALLGIARHEPFGLGMVVGVGGTLVELVADAAFELLPVDAALAREMIGRTKLAGLLAGYRGQPPADLEALIEAMVRLSEVAMTYADRIEAIDLNPVAVLPAGRGIRLLDALLIKRAASPGSPRRSSR